MNDGAHEVNAARERDRLHYERENQARYEQQVLAQLRRIAELLEQIVYASKGGIPG